MDEQECLAIVERYFSRLQKELAEKEQIVKNYQIPPKFKLRVEKSAVKGSNGWYAEVTGDNINELEVDIDRAADIAKEKAERENES